MQMAYNTSMNTKAPPPKETPAQRMLNKPLRKLAEERQFLMEMFDILDAARSQDELHPFPDFVETEYGVVGFPLTRMVALHYGCEINICRNQIVLRVEGEEHPVVLAKLPWHSYHNLMRIPLDYSSIWNINKRQYARAFAKGIPEIIKNMHNLWEFL